MCPPDPGPMGDRWPASLAMESQLDMVSCQERAAPGKSYPLRCTQNTDKGKIKFIPRGLSWSKDLTEAGCCGVNSVGAEGSGGGELS